GSGGVVLWPNDRSVQRASAETPRPRPRAAARENVAPCRGTDAPRALSRLGERCVPARPPRGRGGRRPARRTLFHVHGRRRLLRGHTCPRTTDSVHACC